MLERHFFIQDLDNLLKILLSKVSHQVEIVLLLKLLEQELLVHREALTAVFELIL